MIRFRHTALSLGLLGALTLPAAAAWSLQKALPIVELKTGGSARVLVQWEPGEIRCNGAPVAGGAVDAPIGRHPVDRQRMAVTPGGTPAVTHYRVLRRFRAHTLLRVKLETGRTHQIRVHMAYIRLPLLGDPVYGGRPRLPPGASPRCIEVIQRFRRQALHAERLALRHPVTGEWLEWRAEIPADLAELLAVLGEDVDERHE